MTTGSTSIDTRIYTVFPWPHEPSLHFEGNIGWLTQKDWGGGDYSSPNKPPKGTRYRDRDHPYQQRYSPYGIQVAPRRSKREEHGYSMTALTKYNGVVSWTNSLGTFKSGFEEALGTWSDHQTWTDNDFLTLLEKLRTKTAGSGFNGAVAAAEGAQSLGLIVKTAGNINKAYGNVRRGNVAAAWKNLTNLSWSKRPNQKLPARVDPVNAKAVASAWLELQYGWKPLLNDVFDACASLAHFLNTPLTKSFRVSRERPGTATGGYPHGHFTSSNVYYRVGIIARVSEASVPALLGLTDPASVIWEKTPFSFVADWFIPIGSWLSARGLANSLTATYVISRKRYVELKGWTMTGTGLIAFPKWTSDYSVKYCAFSREITTSLAVPLPSFKPLGKWATWGHAANAVGLLVANWGSSGRGARSDPPLFDSGGTVGYFD